ncbi:thermonuclease family protein [Effusibacillus consociatus]|uniref:Thermonuclease family protein n=1 Tax=Effusibacillus consociatus TaxID=1117041 RepID=A0ABV9Q660_9BACL
MWMTLGILSFLAFIVLAVYGFICLVKKNGRAKKAWLASLVAFILFFIGAVNDSEQPTEKQTANVESKKEQVSAKPTAIDNTPQAQTSAPVVNPARLKAKVLSVTDGDTFKINLNGKEETVRMILVDTPETKHPDKPVQPFGPEASKFSSELLTGKEVELEKDVSERDKYGRLLFYVYVDGKSVQEQLLEKGLARVAVYPPDVKYVDQYRAIQDKARKAGVGIWSIENYARDDGYHPEVQRPTTQPTQEPTKTQQQPQPAPQPAPAPQPQPSNVYYKNCSEARAAGAAPLHRGDPGYRTALDRDGDGVACE